MFNVYILLLICAHTYSFHHHHSSRFILNNKNIQTKWCQLKMGFLDNFKKIVIGQDTKEILLVDNDKQLKNYFQNVEKINALEEKYEKLSNEDLRLKTEEFRSKLFNDGVTLDSLLIDAYAVVREASWRVLQLRHFDVQLVGGMALHNGRLAEMATGEGKTLVAVLPIYLNALKKEGAFVVTTNDYLARRDGETMGQIFRFLGLSVGIIQTYQKEDQRRQAYSCDVTYVANQELGFDFLRDNLAMTLDNVVQVRPFNYCVVDEADSILIDEARTPLIISRKGNGPTAKYISSTQITKSLQRDKHYEVNEKDQKVELTPFGFKYIEKVIGKSLYDLQDPWAYYIINAIKAKELYIKDQQYIVDKDSNTISIVDSFTGRILQGRRFTDGLQQAIEAKENLQVSSETQVVAKVTYQNLFRLFPKLSGMTGTALTDAEELAETYQLKVLPIPTALPIARRDNPDAVFRTKNGKMKALLKNVLTNNEKGRPILIGTTSVETSEEMIIALKDIGVNGKLLNARPENVERESDIIAQAGRLNSVTVSTNMAGRGTDIIIGGSAKGIAKVVAKYMLLICLDLYNYEYKESIQNNNIDDNINNISSSDDTTSSSSSNSGAGDDNEDNFDEIETDEDVLALPSILELSASIDINLPSNPSNRVEMELKRAIVSCGDLFLKNDGNDNDDKNVSLLKVDRIEVDNIISQASDSTPTPIPAIKLLRSAINKLTREFEDKLKIEREVVKKLGGLYVIGTSRHESRRIDNQLRGRTGRQGDIGASRFFLSLEDDIFKLFGADKIASILENFRVAEDMPIENDLVVQALDKVQIQVEEYFRGNRKQVFRLDEVASFQRSVVYSQRRAFLTSTDEGMLETFNNYCRITLDEIYSASVSNNVVNVEKLLSKTLQFFPNMKITAQDLSDSVKRNNVVEVLYDRLDDAVLDKRQEVDSVSSWAFVAFFRYLALVQVDESWCKQLTRLDLLKEEMVLQSFTAEKDVMETYRENAMKLFTTLMDDVRRNTVYSLFIYKPNRK